MIRRRVTVCVFLLLIISMLAAANLNDFANHVRYVAGDMPTVASSNGIFLSTTDDALHIAHGSHRGNIWYLWMHEESTWQHIPIPGTAGGSVQGIAANEDQVVVGFAKEGRIYTVASADSGRHFSSPVEINRAAENASIQDMVIDDDGIIHIMFHRHDRYWDYNYARSTDAGMSYSTALDFTRTTDSNSTGYSGNLKSAHGNLYTVYQDNNDEFAVKLSISKDGGDTWNTTRIAPSSGGPLGLAVDPLDPDLAYIAAFNRDGLTILRIKEATSAQPDFWPMYGDGTIKTDTNAVGTIHIAVAADRTVTAVYLNPATRVYHYLSSKDLGETWQRGELINPIDHTQFRWIADLDSLGNEFFFARSDGRGGLFVHGPDITEAVAAIVQKPESSYVYTPDSQGLVELSSITEPFAVRLSAGMPMILFSVPKNTDYEITHLTQSTIPLYLSLYDLQGDTEQVLAENYDGSNLFDSFIYGMENDTMYILALGVLDDLDYGKTVEFKISQKGTAGHATLPTATTPIPVGSKPEDVGARVYAGYFNTFAIDDLTILYGTGVNSFGQLSLGDTDYRKTFTPIRPSVLEVIGGFGHTLYIGENGDLSASGRNEDYQIGDGTRINELDLHHIASNVVSAGAGYGHTLYVQSDGTVWAFGANQAGQIGDGSTVSRTAPVKIFENGRKVFSNKANSSYIVTTDGDLYGFGDNSYGQLALGHTNNTNKPNYITNNVEKVAGGRNHIVVLKTDGTVWVSGDNSQGQLGNTNSTNRLVKVAADCTDIAAGYYNTYLLDYEGTVLAAGSNKYGQFGIGTTASNSKTVGFVPIFEDALDMDAGRDHAVILKSDGSVWTSGLNEQYQLGDATKGFRRDWKKIYQL
ncbi:hypothetical protein [Pleomorphochaeta sp. DL1XJH-081]|uniref:RCC1 domain-containing protein n=1 Tax=Pleomorphochaeta sp. DL1XJH-081 TaxID=3409690 RepID=UPI003BB64D61